MNGVNGGGRRQLIVVAVGASGVVAVAMAWLVLLPRVFRRNRDALLRYRPVKKVLTVCDDLACKVAGTERSSWGILTHVGRRSGRVYRTPLGAHPFGDGFLLPLGYGPNTDWYRNLVAAGTCELTWKGATYPLEQPEVVSGPEIMRSWPMRDRLLLRMAGMRCFVWMHAPVEQVAKPPLIDSPAERAAP
ncbi:nitroreductase family deazaflavin-dependent oxidoreductase [Nocardia miyunensis]|uniref:nitroreductase family deazaflavin-dependent oxidoreductase n=1 Tax=Nocardia miyunensis TaxID=282684 RepID=UPI0012F4E56A|nr:nitroreductase family deazaflavin-dependent oxidoreductase [Nocardia miyunensis]